MQFEYLRGEEGCAYFVRGHVPIDDFMTDLNKQVDRDDPILLEEPEHCWMRACRDFQQGNLVYVEAVPNSQGAFKCTWIQDN